MTAAVRTAGLTVGYGSFLALTDLDVEIPAGLITGIVGPNGAGKTTLLNAISGFAPATAGTIEVDGVQVQGRRTTRRARDGIIRGFQTVRLMERETVLTNVLVGCERLRQPWSLTQLLALPGQTRARRRDLAAAGDIIDILGLSAQKLRQVDELPFASRRLVEVARVLVSQPPLVLLDEPAAGLDQQGRSDLVRVLGQVHREHPGTLVIVEHDVDLVQRLCDHAIALDSGQLVTAGPPADVFADARVQLAYFGKAAG
jgi:branched-chain amino acid transport system ATP-binding protein